MLTLSRNSFVLALSLALTACPSDDPSNSSTTETESDEDSDTNNTNSGTVSVTLGGTMSTSDTDTDPSTTTVDPTTSTTDDPTTEATVDPDSSSSSATDPTTDSSGSESSSTGDDGGATIYEIQDGTIADGTDVEVFGVVVTAVGSSGFWAEEPAGGEYSGVFVYSGNQTDELGVPKLAIGDVVDFTGTVQEYIELTEINISQANGTLVVVGTGEPITPDVVEISVFDADLTAEPWESTLVRIEGTPLSVTVLEGDGEYTVSDGTDECIIDDFIYDSSLDDASFPDFAAGATFDAIQGPVNWFNSEWKIMPRAASDLEGYAAP